MKANYTYLLLLLTSINTFYGYSQNTITIKDAVSQSAFNKNIMQDINFMVLGDNNIKQGFAYEYDKDKTELSLNGGLSNNKSYILTVDGSFSVDDGVFVFDNKDGSKKGKLSFNIFIPACFGNYKSFPNVKNNEDSNLANRARHRNYLIETEYSKKVLDTFMTLDAVMFKLGLPQSSIKKKKSFFLDGSVDRYYNQKIDSLKKENEKKNPIPDEKILKILLKYYTSSDPNAKYATLNNLLTVIMEGTKKTVIIIGKEEKLEYDVPEGLNIDALFKDYEKAVERAINIDKEVDDLQIKNFSNIWRSETNTYFGISPYYERESLDTYKSDSTITVFKDRFKEQRGDLYGVRGSLNYIKRYHNGIFYMARGLVTFGRASNFKDFKKKEYVYSTIVDQIGSNDIVEEQKKTGYYTKNNSLYQYGFSQQYSIELYASLKAIGIYGKIGYSNNKALAKKETLSFETGFMINLKSEKKNIVSVLLFVSREDLNIHPEDDMNFGFKIGLPINIRKSQSTTGDK